MEENGKGLCFVDLLLIVLPAFLIFGAGFIGQKLLKLDIKSISTMSLYLMLPFLTFDTFYSNELNIEYFYMFLFTCLLAIIMIILTVIFGLFIKADKTQMSAMLLGTIFPNSGNYGAPVAMFAFGAIGFQYAVIFMVIHAFLMNTIGIFIASYGSEKTTSIKDSLMSSDKNACSLWVFIRCVISVASHRIAVNHSRRYQFSWICFDTDCHVNSWHAASRDKTAKI